MIKSRKLFNDFLCTDVGQRYNILKEELPKPESLSMQDEFYFAKYFLSRQAMYFLKTIHDYGMNNNIPKWRRLGLNEKIYQVSLTLNHLEEINRALHILDRRQT